MSIRKNPGKNPGVDTSDFFYLTWVNSVQNAMLIIDGNGYIIAINQSFQTQFGYAETDIIGKHFRLLFTREDQQLQKPEMEIATVKENGSAEDTNYLMHKNGTAVWVKGESVLVEANTGIYISKIIHNIHSQKVMERFLIESNDFVEKILKNITDALIVVDDNLRIIRGNQAFYDMFEIPEQTIEGILLYDLNYSFWNDSGMQDKLELLVERAHGVSNSKFEWKKPDGSSRHLQLRAVIMDRTGERNKILLMITDVTLEIQIEQQREDLIAFVTHELRNPLSNIALSLNLVTDSIEENRASETQEYLQKIQSNIKRLSAVVDELQDATRAGSGQLKIEKSGINLNDLIDDAIGSVSLLSSRHTITKQTNGDLGVEADTHRILQVLTNFLSNAVKYSSEGDILINATRKDDTIVVSVTNHGEGIPPEKLNNIFTRYYRAENSMMAEGLGLGLFLAREIIHAHGGDVWVESEINKTTTFYFSLPASK